MGIKIKWSGSGVNEVAKIEIMIKDKYPKLKKNMKVIKIDKKYFRPNEVENLIGDFSKSKKVLNWKPKTSIDT